MFFEAIYPSSNASIKSVATSISGFDGSDGAGFCADYKVLKPYFDKVCGALTSVTAQSSTTFNHLEPVSDQILGSQLSSICEEVGNKIDCIKIGLIANPLQLDIIKNWLEKVSCNLIVLDPIIKSSSGKLFWHDEDLGSFINFFSSCDYITPNFQELCVLAKFFNLSCPNSFEELERVMVYFEKKLNVKLVVKSISLDNIRGEAILDNNKNLKIVSTPVFEGVWRDIHGSGCIFSSSMMIGLQKGHSLSDAIVYARKTLQSYIL